MILLAAALAAATADAPPLRLATYAYPAYDRRAALAPLARLIEAETGRPVETVLYPSPEALAAALRARRADLAMTNLAAFIDASRERAVRPIAALTVPARMLDGYRGVLLARRDAGVARMDDLPAAAGKLRYAEVLPGSTSGALVQADAIRRAGGRPDAFATVERAGTHDAALERLLANRADVAALAEAPWRALKSSRPSDAAGLVELWRSDPLPPGPVVCVEARTTPCARIAARLLRGDAGSRTVAAELAKGWSETAGASSFQAVRRTAYKAFIRR